MSNVKWRSFPLHIVCIAHIYNKKNMRRNTVYTVAAGYCCLHSEYKFKKEMKYEIQSLDMSITFMWKKFEIFREIRHDYNERMRMHISCMRVNQVNYNY